MDDTQDKVRRNLVVFSTAIVIGWFLDIKLAVLTKLIVPSPDLDSVSTVKLWIVTLLVLLYLSLRYRFHTATISQKDALSNELNTQKQSYLSKYLTRKLSRISKTDTSHQVFDTSLMDSISERVKQLEEIHSCRIKFRLSLSEPWGASSSIEPNTHNHPWSGTVSISKEFSKSNSAQNLVVLTGRRFDFNIPILGRIWIIAHAIIHTSSYSRSAIEFIVPLVLSGAAFAIAAFKLVVLLS